MTSRGSQSTTSKKRRHTGGSSGTKSNSITAPYIDIKEVLDSAKAKFELDQKRKSTTTLSSPGQTKFSSEKTNKKSVSAPASPNKSLQLLLPSDEQPVKRARLMRSSLSPKGRRASLLMPVSEASSQDESSDTNSIKKTSLNESSKSKKSSKGLNMNEFWNKELASLHQDEGYVISFITK